MRSKSQANILTICFTVRCKRSTRSRCQSENGNFKNHLTKRLAHRWNRTAKNSPGKTKCSPCPHQQHYPLKVKLQSCCQTASTARHGRRTGRQAATARPSWWAQTYCVFARRWRTTHNVSCTWASSKIARVALWSPTPTCRTRHMCPRARWQLHLRSVVRDSILRPASHEKAVEPQTSSRRFVFRCRDLRANEPVPSSACSESWLKFISHTSRLCCTVGFAGRVQATSMRQTCHRLQATDGYMSFHMHISWICFQLAHHRNHVYSERVAVGKRERSPCNLDSNCHSCCKNIPRGPMSAESNTQQFWHFHFIDFRVHCENMVIVDLLEQSRHLLRQTIVQCLHCKFER